MISVALAKCLADGRGVSLANVRGCRYMQCRSAGWSSWVLALTMATARLRLLASLLEFFAWRMLFPSLTHPDGLPHAAGRHFLGVETSEMTSLSSNGRNLGVWFVFYFSCFIINRYAQVDIWDVSLLRLSVSIAMYLFHHFYDLFLSF